MSTILVPNTVMVELIFTHFLQRVENVFHVDCGGAPTEANLLAIKNVFQLWDRNSPTVATNLCAQRSTMTNLVQISLTSLHVAGGPVLDYVLPTASVGLIGVVMAITDTVAVKWTTRLAGRAHRGRTYHVGLAYSPATDGLLTVAHAGLIQACYARLITDVSTAGFELVVASKYEGVEIVGGYRRAIPRSSGIITEITGCGVERGIDTQRHRKIPHMA